VPRRKRIFVNCPEFLTSKQIMMKKIVRSQLLLLAIIVVTSSLSFSQEKYGSLTLYTLQNEMGKDA
jgi:hypothetical protein